MHQYHQPKLYNTLPFYPPSMVTLGAANVTSSTSCELRHCTQPVCVLPHPPHAAGLETRLSYCKCHILLTHVILLGYSSLNPRPLVQGYWLLWSVCAFFLVCSSPEELRRRVPSLSLTRAQEICSFFGQTFNPHLVG